MMNSRTYIAVPPGASIKEQLLERGMTQKEFAIRMDMSEKHISKLINGEVNLTMDVARRLEMILGIPATFWCNLEAIYRETLVKVAEENEMDADIEYSKNFPYSEMVKNKWIEDAKKPNEKVTNLRKFFEVSKLTLIDNSYILGIACRRLSETEKGDYALIAMAQEAKKEARKKSVEPINVKKLIRSIPEIRALTTTKPQFFCQRLEQILSECGIAIVFLPGIKGSFLHGATFFDCKKIVIGMTVRGKDADRFWFSLFHEIAHIVNGHINKSEGLSSDDEKDADIYATNTLINPDDFNSFTRNKIDYENIVRFSELQGIAPGIVVGRLQKEGYLRYNQYNNLKEKYVISV